MPMAVGRPFLMHTYKKQTVKIDLECNRDTRRKDALIRVIFVLFLHIAKE